LVCVLSFPRKKTATDILPRIESGDNTENRLMPRKPEAFRDWHRLFGLLLTDFFTGSPFTVEIERDLSVQQQLLDYDCQWGTDRIRVVVAGELAREPHNAPLHLFSAAPDLVGFGGRAYQRHSPNTSGLLVQLFEGLQAEGFPMPYTMEDFQRKFVKEHFAKLTPEEREDVIKSLPPEERLVGLSAEERLAGLSAEQIRQYLDRLSAARPAAPRKPRRKT
jgi:hypothetical protein